MSQTDFNDRQIAEPDYPACLSVVIPVYNEAETLSEVVGKVVLNTGERSE